MTRLRARSHPPPRTVVLAWALAGVCGALGCVGLLGTDAAGAGSAGAGSAAPGLLSGVADLVPPGARDVRVAWLYGSQLGQGWQYAVAVSWRTGAGAAGVSATLPDPIAPLPLASALVGTGWPVTALAGALAALPGAPGAPLGLIDLPPGPAARLQSCAGAPGRPAPCTWVGMGGGDRTTGRRVLTVDPAAGPLAVTAG
ncbi:MAG: hypothetical protein ACYDB7_06690 [Mycobacteriales bacterium]